MNELEHVIHLLKNKNATLDENNLRLYWQDEFKHGDIVAWKSGWRVITWKRSKAVDLYFGDFFSDALEVFEKHTKENEQ